jgi:alpha-tubulin suppressor-like RCC1 family protein
VRAKITQAEAKKLRVDGDDEKVDESIAKKKEVTGEEAAREDVTRFVQFTCGAAHIVALGADGSVFTWGTQDSILYR